MWGSQGWNQWSFQPAMFNDVPHEQIDWAELAKQWIQMQHTPTSDAPPPPPPRISSPVSLPPPPGHGPLPPTDFPVVNPPMSSKAGPPASVPPPFHSERMYDGEPGTYLPKASNNNFWNKPHWESSMDSDGPGRLWPSPMLESTAPLIGGKETFDYGHVRDNPPLAMQSIDYNHMSDFSYDQVYPLPPPPPPTHYDQYWSQVNAAPSISPMFLKKQRTSSNLPVEDSSQIDAAKRKSLPVWIRDGLEKMEQERIKRIEKERADKEAREHAEIMAKTASLRKELNLNDKTVPNVPAKSKFESDSEEEEEKVKTIEVVEKRSSRFEKEQSLPVEDLRTEEEKKQEMMMKVRRTLTEVLLSVTNSEMIAIAQEVYKKAASKAPARQLASTTLQTSVVAGLRGLASYGTESEASEVEEEGTDSEEELYRKIKEKKNLFAIKERKIIAELEQKEFQEKIRAENLKNEKIRERRLSKETEKAKSSENNSADETSAENPSQPPSDQNSKKTEVSKTSVPEIKLEKSEESSGPKLKEKHSTASSSSSSESEGGSSEKRKKSSKDKKKHKTEDTKVSPKKDRNPDKHDRHHKSKSRESASPEKPKRERSVDQKSNSKKKKRSRRSESSSSSSSSLHRKSRHSSRYESNHRSHDRDHKRKRSRSSSRSRRKTSESHSSRRYKDERRHRSPSKHSTKLPRKYRSSSTESEGSGKKSKKYRSR